MKQLLYSLLLIVWSLWFGGMIALLIFVTRLFGASHDTGVIGAPVLFRTFAIYQLILGLIAVVLALTLLAWTRGLAVLMAVVFLVISAALALPIRTLTYKIDQLRMSGQSQTDEFKSAHKWSSIQYTASVASLLAAGVALSLSRLRRSMNEKAV